MARRIQAPGIEVNEIDYSSYETSESLVNTTAFIMGFADKGTDYATRYVNNMNNYVKMFGAPHTEAETYLYNATNEIISKGGNVYVSKLPYDNNSLNKYSYVEYEVDDTLKTILSPQSITNTKIIDLSGCGTITFQDFCFYPDFIFLSSENIIESGDGSESISEVIESNFLSVCNENNIKLNLIEKFVRSLILKNNLTENETNLYLNLFYSNDVDNKFRNDSTYILSTLYINHEELSNFNILSYSLYSELHEKFAFLGSYKQEFNRFIEELKITDFYDYIDDLKNQFKNVKISELNINAINHINNILNSIKFEQSDYSEINKIDNTITSYIQIKSKENDYSGLMDLELLDNLKIKSKKVENNTIRIVDISRTQYNQEYNIENYKNPREYLGILPVITTAANALYYQNIIKNSDKDFKNYNALSFIRNITTSNTKTKDGDEINYTIRDINNETTNNVGFVYNLGSEKNTKHQQTTISKIAASYFPNIKIINDKIDRKHIKDIGVVVFKMSIESSLDYKISLIPVESYVGSLNRYEIDKDTKSHRFIDDIINENSSLINFYSNVKFSKNDESKFTNADVASTFIISNQKATSLGFYSKDCLKQISLQESIYNAIDKIFDKNVDINDIELDFLVDAGVSNIAQFIKSVYPKTHKGYYDFDEDYAYLFKIDNNEDTTAWSYVIEKYNKYCKNTRKDCMFIADGLRPLCLNGNEKVVRNTKPENTIENTILKNIKYLSTKINSSYGAGYLDWYLMINTFNNELFWCPPSIKAAGIYIYTDLYSYYWNAPAGLNRGKLDSGVVDVAFSPNLDQAGIIYNNCWNYSVNYPIDGIVLEGQKTFQRDKTAFDRINVRRLFLGLEKEVRYIAKYFKYDQITDYLMTRFVDAITPIFEEAKNKGGLKEYVILCDRNNNTIQTIENNELHCTIGVKPIKSAEFIVLNFICTNQSADVQEIVQNY